MKIKIDLSKKVWLISFITAVLLSHHCFAEEIKFIPRAWTGISDYHYKQGSRKEALPDGSDFPAVHFDATLYLIGIGLTSVYKQSYLDLSYQDSSEDHDTFSGANFYEKFTGDRRDYSATLGIKILDNRGSVYIGYKNGKTSGKGHKGTKLTFREDGFFIGASYGWIIADKGLLAINTAYADLDGNLKEVPGSVYPASLGMDADSKTNGLSYGISWTSNISDKLSFSIALDVNDYEFDSLKDSSTNTPLPDKIEEEFRTAKISFYYLF